VLIYAFERILLQWPVVPEVFMRFVPLLTALLVCAVTYMAIMERDLLFSYAGVARAQTEEAPKEVALEDKPAVTVVALQSQQQPVARGIVLRGQTEASRAVDAKSEATGLVISQPIRKGTNVNKGQLLCKLDPGTLEASLTEAKARLAEAEAKNAVSSSLVSKGYASETQAIGRKAALEGAEAALKRIQKQIEKLEITAPFAGLLESDTAEFGALLLPGAPCATVIALDPIKLVGFATEQQVSRISVGSPAGARLVDNTELSGQVTFISRRADKQTRTFRVEITVPNADLAIRDGSTAEIYIALAGDQGHLLPQSSLTLDDTGRLGVRTAIDGKAKFFPVAIINDSPDGVWVTGLPPKIDVIVVGQEYVVDGRRVAVTYEKDPS